MGRERERAGAPSEALMSECGSAGRRGKGIMEKPFKPLPVLGS